MTALSSPTDRKDADGLVSMRKPCYLTGRNEASALRREGAIKRHRRFHPCNYYRRESSRVATIFRNAAVPVAASSDRRGTQDRIETRRGSHAAAPEDGRTLFGSGCAGLGVLCLSPRTC